MRRSGHAPPTSQNHSGGRHWLRLRGRMRRRWRAWSNSSDTLPSSATLTQSLWPGDVTGNMGCYVSCQWKCSYGLMFNGCCDVIRYGRRSLAKRRCDQNQEAENAAQFFPLLDQHDDNDDQECTRKMKTREFRLASRCQVNITHAYRFI